MAEGGGLVKLFRNYPEDIAKRVPPGQRLVKGWPVLHYGPIPKFDEATWDLKVFGDVENPFTLTYSELKELGPVTVDADMHCVTGWTTLDNTWPDLTTPQAVAKASVRRIFEFDGEDALGARVERVEACGKGRSEGGEIGLRDDKRVGDRDLACGFSEAVERRGALDRVNQGYDPAQAQPLIEHRVGAESKKDRRRIGETARLDRDAAERPKPPGVTPLDQVAQALRKILPHHAAEAATRQLEDAALDKIHEKVVDRDRADLVDNDRRIGKRGGGKRAAQQRRLAAAEKSGQQRHRQIVDSGDARHPGLAVAPPRSFHAGP